MEGQDYANGSRTNFEDKINKLKSRPDKKVLEEEYIKVRYFYNVRGCNRR